MGSVVGGALNAVVFSLSGGVPGGLVPAEFSTQRADGGGGQVGLSIVVLGPGVFAVVFGNDVAIPTTLLYQGWLYSGADLFSSASGDYLMRLAGSPIVLAVVNRGGNNVAVIFDREVTVTAGIDGYFIDTIADQIVWVGGVGTVQLGSFNVGGASGNGWEWTPGGGSGKVVPDTSTNQAGTIV